MGRRKNFLMIGGFVLLLAFLTSTVQAQTKPIVWNMATNILKGNSDQDIFMPNYLFPQILYEETGGLISVKVKDNLFPAKETLYAVADGRAQIGYVAHNNHIGDKPLWGLPLLPFLFANGTQMTCAWLYDREFQKMYQDSHNAIGLQMIAFCSPTPQAVWSKKKPIASVADFKGMKIRTSSMLQQLALIPLGATNVTIPFGELFTSLERGVVDGAITSIAAGNSIGLNSICTSVANWPITPLQPYAVTVNKRTYDDLPKNIQEAVTRAGHKASLMVSYGANMEWLLSQKIAEGAKIKVISPTTAELEKGRALMGKAWDSWFELTGAEGKRWFNVAKARIEKDAQMNWAFDSK